MNKIIARISETFNPRKPDINEIAAQTVSRHEKALRMLAEYDRV